VNLPRIILREAAFRKLNFLLGALSVAAAVACLAVQTTVLRRHDLQTERIIAAREAETRAKMAALEDDIRKITVNMGFNVVILPKAQNLGDFYAEDYAAETMPEEYAQRLAQSRVATINHILPSLQQKVVWPETQRTILLMGVRGVVYLQNSNQKPMLDAVPPGTAVVGYELHQSLGLKEGDPLTLMGRTFTIGKLNPARGTKDDIALWIDLREAQEMLGKQGRINGILALDCTCATDRLSLIRAEIEKILPDTQVIEFASQAIARSETRARAAAEADAAIASDLAQRDRLRAARESLAAMLVPAFAAGSALWIGFLALANVRDRRAEIGIFRALGLRGRHVIFIFLGRAIAVGLAGAAMGIAAGIVIAAGWRESPDAAGGGLEGIDWIWLAGAFVIAPALAALASWLPAVHASQQDPASVLRET
jgi:ABC-type lipoprotein release transport system permease subunit